MLNTKILAYPRRDEIFIRRREFIYMQTYLFIYLFIPWKDFSELG